MKGPLVILILPLKNLTFERIKFCDFGQFPYWENLLKLILLRYFKEINFRGHKPSRLGNSDIKLTNEFGLCVWSFWMARVNSVNN